MTQADIILSAFRRYLVDDTAEVERIHWDATRAALDGQTAVTITSSNFPEGGSAAGELRGHPETVMAVCEQFLLELEAVEAGTPTPGVGTEVTHFDLSRNYSRT